MEDLHKAAKVGFASSYAFFIKAQNFHWNVTGPDFFQYHELFGKIYQETYSDIDDFAENIRKLGAHTPASFQRFSLLTQIEDENQVLPKDAMVVELLQDNEKMINVLKLVYELSEKYKEVGFSNFIADRIDAHRTHGWMLRSSIEGL